MGCFRGGCVGRGVRRAAARRPARAAADRCGFLPRCLHSRPSGRGGGAQPRAVDPRARRPRRRPGRHARSSELGRRCCLARGSELDAAPRSRAPPMSSAGRHAARLGLRRCGAGGGGRPARGDRRDGKAAARAAGPLRRLLLAASVRGGAAARGGQGRGGGGRGQRGARRLARRLDAHRRERAADGRALPLAHRRRPGAGSALAVDRPARQLPQPQPGQAAPRLRAALSQQGVGRERVGRADALQGSANWCGSSRAAQPGPTRPDGPGRHAYRHRPRRRGGGAARALLAGVEALPLSHGANAAAGRAGRWRARPNELRAHCAPSTRGPARTCRRLRLPKTRPGWPQRNVGRRGPGAAGHPSAVSAGVARAGRALPRGPIAVDYK
mmetsp:Transcript_3237/g.8033  ORF Transcript_3237/g.8033 Transcript_3237/m.8033 type:complete len:384 (+) Transcript_3237:735-1886(+)